MDELNNLFKEKCAVNENRDDIFWNKIRKNNVALDIFRKRCKYLFSEYGTSLQCNRFDVGNCIEFAFSELLNNNDYAIKEVPNAKRIDIEITNYDDISIKYSSSGNIKIHNSLGRNTDQTICKTIIITPKKIFMISHDLVEPYAKISNYLKNTGDGLELKRKLLTTLNKNKYPYVIDCDIVVDKDDCKNIQCSKVLWEHVKIATND